MTKLMSVTADDAAQLQRDLLRAFEGGPALGLGMLGDQPEEVADGTAVVIGTSGSTGVPKRVVLSAEALRAGADATARRIGTGSWLLALPAGYVAGLQVIVRSIFAETDPVVLGGRFSPESFAQATHALPSSARFTALVPAQIATLIDASDDPDVLAALRAYDAILVGGQALPQPLRDRAADLGARLVRTYGSTETSGGCVYDGRPLETAAVRTVDGELQIAGPMLADGYLGDPALTDRTFIRDEHGIRWYRTGDLGIVEDGRVQVQGRADNVIVSGGINISLDRVERIVRGIPGLTGAVVVAVEDERWGESSVIVAARGRALRRSETEQLEQARAAVAAEIGKHARPARLILVDELATLPSGKPDREAIRRIAAVLR
ncbi:AMP-binding protein [Microbacterium paludicola]|uniref:AMP-binding protein n=1 Tax=Microbacterium paludicola TaxID=300019 RepID=UPI0016426074|nr:AMP-binding protein [Microbacterium paludicola]